MFSDQGQLVFDTLRLYEKEPNESKNCMRNDVKNTLYACSLLYHNSQCLYMCLQRLSPLPTSFGSFTSVMALSSGSFCSPKAESYEGYR